MPNQPEQEWSDALSFSDWQACEFAKETLSQAYFEAGEELRKELKPIPARDTSLRNVFQAYAWNTIDQTMDDAYNEYLAMHPNQIGHFTETFGRLYGQDGL